MARDTEETGPTGVKRSKVLKLLAKHKIEFKYTEAGDVLTLEHNPIKHHRIILSDPVSRRMVSKLSAITNIRNHEFYE